MKRRTLSILTCLALCLTLLPVTALAAGVPYIYYTWNDATQTLSDPIRATANATAVTGNDTAWGGTGNTNGWYVVSGTVTIDHRVTVTGDVHLILANGCELIVTGGIQVADGNSLTIYGQAGGTGTLTATGSGGGAGIGGNTSQTAGTVTIHGGTVEATGGDSGGGAGIGGGNWGGSGGTVTIYGGAVTANNGANAAGIGGGSTSDSGGGAGGTVIIHGGTVTANGGGGAAGIGGGGYNGASTNVGGTVIITGGTVTATGGSNAAGIGGGNWGGNGGTVTITGGTVTATGGRNGAGIGGNKGDGGTVIITGGTVTATGGSDGAGIGGGYAGSSGTFSTGGDGNAVIFASSISNTTSPGVWHGVIFQGGSGQVYGDSVTPTEDFTIPNGKTLTIGENKTLNIPAGVTLTNKGTITNNGTVNNYGAVNNDGTINNSGTWTNRFSIALTPASSSLTVGNITTLTASAILGTVTGSAVGGSKAANETAPYSWTWESNKPDVAKVEADQTVSTQATVTAVSAGTAIITVTTVDGQKTDSCAVTVTEPYVPPVTPEEDDSDPTYSVSWPRKVEGGTVTVKKSYAQEGETFRFTLTPDEGYELDALSVTDSRGRELDLTAEGGGEYSFEMPGGRVEIEVSFRENAAPLPFADVAEGYWAYDEIAWAYGNGCMSGTAATTFHPGGTVSRQQVWMILARMAGADPADMAAAKAWAVESGISDGTDPGGAVTRQQLAALLYRYAVQSGYDVSVGEDTNILSYTDAFDVAEYAVPAMQWACGAGILNGTGDGSTLSPQGSATRAQLAVMLYRWLA